MVTSKTIPAVFFSIIFSVFVPIVFAQPTAYDVDSLRQETYRTIEDFYEQSLSLRLQYDHAGTFVSDEHKEQLLTLAEDADVKLNGLYDKQRQLRADIEAYDSDDWDKLFGVTGLWKSLYAGQFEILWLRKQVGYYIAIASPGPERLQIADKIIGWCESDKNRFKNAQTKLLKAKASAIIGVDSKGYKQQATEIIEELADSKVHDGVYFQAMLLRFKITGDINRLLLAEMAEEIAKSELSDDFELNARIAFTGLKVGVTKYLDAVIAKWSGSEKLIAEIILERLIYLEKNGRLSEKILARQSVSEILLAIKAVIETPEENHISLLVRLDAVEKFRCSLLSYAMAQAYVNDSPILAVEHYIAAATSRNIDKTASLTKIELATMGASAAVKLYNEDKKHCGIANRALMFYCRVAAVKADGEMTRLYFETLDQCLGKDKAEKQLHRLAKSDGYFSDVAGFEIARRKVENEPTKENYVHAVKILAGAEQHCGYLQNASAMLYDIRVRIDEYMEEYPAFIDDCYFLAKQLSGHSREKDRRLVFVKIEFGVLAGDDVEQLWQEFKTIDDGTSASLRTAARLLQTKGQYAEAAVMWKKIYTSLQQDADGGPGYPWWQGKYYELWCVSQLADTKQADVAHAARVLESSYGDIPPFWAKKLGEL